MKKMIFLLSILFSITYCFGADFLVIQDAKIYDGDYEYKGSLNKGDIVQLWDTAIFNEKDNDKLDFDYCAHIILDGEKRLVDASVIIPAETTELFDENLLSIKLNERGLHWTTKTELDILYSQTRTTYYNLHTEHILDSESHRGIYDGPWYEYVSADNIPFHNISIFVEDGIKFYLQLFIRKITKTDKGYYVETELAYDPLMDYSYENTLLEDLLESKLVNLNIIIDGDYLYLYTKKNKLLTTYVLVDGSVSEQYINLMRNDECDLSLVNWPRHADGSCDYDVRKDTKVKQSAIPITPNQLMSATENLKLRSSEANTYKVLTVMAAGTNVKILELGHEETIDGITSNWVKVELFAGAIDRDGNAIEKGTIGWCYGGCLEEVETDESEFTDNEITAMKSVNEKNAILSFIIPIAAGVLLLIIVIVIVVVVRKKKKQ